MHASPARACGIDFGTSNSTVGWLRPGQPTLLTLEDGKPTLPSVVFFNAEADTVSVGRNGEFAHNLMEDVYWRTRRRLQTLCTELASMPR